MPGWVISRQLRKSGTVITFLNGRDPRDASQLTQRICGVCPTAHATASVRCLDSAFKVKPTAQGRLLRNLVFASNYLQSHILHFYHLAALDYVKGPGISRPLFY